MRRGSFSRTRPYFDVPFLEELVFLAVEEDEVFFAELVVEVFLPEELEEVFLPDELVEEEA